MGQIFKSQRNYMEIFQGRVPERACSLARVTRTGKASGDAKSSRNTYMQSRAIYISLINIQCAITAQ